ncbi:MAG TPA: AraC family transcriptional regulator [Chthonomonadaceae bacterium]|nr:AraC family transcriptional regulator [Chthonomonadaceae bacterium]
METAAFSRAQTRLMPSAILQPGNPMLTIHRAESFQTPADTCPMTVAGAYNFVSQLRSAEIAFEEHDGPLGIKTCFGGQETYEVEGGRFAVDASSYCVLNNGQRYASAIHSSQTVESFCIWFRPAFAEQVLSGLCSPDDRLLDDPQRVSGQPVAFFERLYPHDDLVSPVLFRIRQAIQDETASLPWLDEQFYWLLERLLQTHRNIYAEMERLPALRQTTRAELYRRLYRAKDFLDASLEFPVTIPEAAQVACLSPHHFLRQFKHLFRETPHQYHRRRRLEKARDLLIGTEQSVTDICFLLGFESLGSFSWLFRRHYGLSPAQYRAEYGRHRSVRLLSDESQAVVGPKGALADGSYPCMK